MEIIDAVKASVAYIDTHLDAPLTVSSLAAQYNFSETHFRRCFHEYTGVPVSTYIRLARAALAAQELMRKLSVKCVAERCGYGMSSTLIHVFKDVYGVTPSVYKDGLVKELPVIKHMTPITLACYVLHRAEDGAKGLALWHGWDFSRVDPDDFNRVSPEGGAEIALWAELDGERSYLFGVTCAEDAEIPKGMIRYTLPPATYALFPVPGSEDTAQLFDKINTELSRAMQHCDAGTPYVPLSSRPCLEYYYKSDVYLCVPIDLGDEKNM